MMNLTISITANSVNRQMKDFTVLSSPGRGSGIAIDAAPRQTVAD
jgi:hypothetical protein